MPRPPEPSISVPSGKYHPCSTRRSLSRSPKPNRLSARAGEARAKGNHMRKRVLLFAAPLCAVAIAASVAVAAPSGAEHSRGPKLDKLHAVRPIAACKDCSRQHAFNSCRRCVATAESQLRKASLPSARQPRAETWPRGNVVN